MMLKKWIAILALALCLPLSLTVYAQEAEIPDIPAPLAASSGTCGDGLSWTLEGTVLTISGTGAMEDYPDPKIDPDSPPAPWGTAITRAVVEEGVTTIGNCAFFQCADLASISLPGTLKTIGNTAFGRCSSLSAVELPDGLTVIDDFAFGECTALTEIDLPDSVQSIGEYAFISCESLKRAALPAGLPSIADGLFFECTALPEIDIPNGVTSIGMYAFLYCGSLARLSLPQSLTSIKESAFNSCSALANVYYTGTEEAWSRIKIDGYNDPLSAAAIHYNFAPSLSASIQDRPDGGTAVQVDAAVFNSLVTSNGQSPTVFALHLESGRPSDAALGAPNSAGNTLTFSAALRPGDRLFFLDPVTFVPLAKPAVLT